MENSTKINMPTLKADDIIEKAAVARVQELDTLINNMADSLSKASSGKNLLKYWKTQDELIKDVIASYKTYNKESSKDNATELIKTINALKAIAGVDLSNILPNFDEFTKSFNNAKKKVGNLDSAFSVKGFKEVFNVFETLEQQGLDVQEVFSRLGTGSNVSKLQNNIRSLEDEVEKLTKRLIIADDARDALKNEFDNFKTGSGISNMMEDLDEANAELEKLRNEAVETFENFLKITNVAQKRTDQWGMSEYDFDDYRFQDYFQRIKDGSMTAQEAIADFKLQYDYLLKDSSTNNDSFGLDQLQAFSTKLDSIFHQVEDTSNKINDILSNGVIAKSVQNLSEDTALSDSQRSIFGNILQDEESLKSVTALFQKLIDETNQTKNTEVFNTEQFTKLESLFTSIESSLSSIKGILVDVGDGEELSPLLKTIANIESAINNLGSSVKGIGLNMNIDFGSDTEMEAKAQAKISNALQAYQNLFEHIKMSSAGGSYINNKFFDFDINQFDTPMSKLQAYIKFIKDMREEAKKMFGGKDILKINTDDKYWNRASAAMGQVKKTFNEMKAANDTNPLENIFGKTDLTEVISQLENIVSKLDEISVSAKGFTETFKNGLNVNASVEEIEKLTNRVKELEDELAKVKTPTIATTPQESNISSGSNSAIEQQIKQQNKLQDEIKETIALTNEYGEVIDVYRGTHGLIGNGNVSNRYHGGTFWTSNRKLATQSYADGNKVTHANLYMRNPYLVHGGGADWDQLTLSIKQGEELEKHLENVYASINDVFSKIQNTSGIEAGHLFDVFDGQLNFTDFENGIQKPIESLKDFQNIFESIDYDNSKIPQAQNYINQLYDLFTSYSRISQLSEKGVLNTNEVVEIAKALKYDGVVFNGIRDGSDDSSDIFVTFEEKQSKVIDMITAAQLRAEEEQQLANILVNTRENLYKTLKSLDSKQVDEFIDKSAFNFVTDGSYMENLGEVLGKADPTDSIDNIKNKIREYINEVVNEFENAQKQIADSTDQTKDAFPSTEATASVEKLEQVSNVNKEVQKAVETSTLAIKENAKVIDNGELPALDELVKKANEAAYELTKGKDIVSQIGKKQVYKVTETDENGKTMERIVGQFSYVEKSLDGQLKNVLATYDESTGRWNEEVLSLATNFEKVGKEIISLDNKINKLEMHRDKMVSEHPNYDTSADDELIDVQKARRNVLEQTIGLYANEKEYVYEVDAFEKKRIENNRTLLALKDQQNNSQKVKMDEKADKQLIKDWEDAIKFNQEYDTALEKTNELLSKLSVPKELESQWLELIDYADKLRSKLANNEIGVSDYKSSIKSKLSEYNSNVGIQQKRDIDEYNSNVKADNANKLEREKQIWNELTTSLDRYATLQKRIASNNALSTDNEEATELLEHIHELQRSDILPTEKLTASNEKLQQINQTVTDLKAKLKESTLDSLQDSIDKYQKIYDKKSTYPSDFTPNKQYIKNLTELKTAIGDLEKYKDTLKNVSEVTIEQEAELKRLVTTCEKASDSFKSLSASEKGASQIAIDKLVQRINKDLDECTNYSKEAKLGLRALRDELESANPRNLKEITSEIINIENAEIKAGRAGRSFFDTLKNSGFHQLAAQMAGMFGFYDVINVGKEAISTIVSLDDALVDLKKTTAMNSTQLEDFYYDANDVAKQMGVTTEEIITQASSWSRLGYSSQEAATTMAKLSSKFASISPGMSTDEAQEGLVSIMKAFDIDPDDVETEIMDKVNVLGNKFAEENQDVIEGLKRSAAAMSAMGQSFTDTAALFTGGMEILQDSESMGTALRTLSMRVRGYDEETNQLSDDLANVTGEVADLTKTAQDSQGVSLFTDTTQEHYRSMVEYLGDIADRWDQISEKNQTELLQKLFGKNRANESVCPYVQKCA